MTLLIAFILIYGLKLSAWWYLIAGAVWLISLVKPSIRSWRNDIHSKVNEDNLSSLHTQFSEFRFKLDSLERNIADLDPRDTFLKELPKDLATIEKKLDDQARELRKITDELKSQLDNLEAEVQGLRD